MSDNTLFLRLAGPMQSWGTSSRFQLRRTDSYPSKSGILGLLLCAKGVHREDSLTELEPLVSLSIGIRVDRAGTPDWDYHTAGAKIGIRKADGKIKKTASTCEYETLLSRRQYLWDASFLVALYGPTAAIGKYAAALADPVWPIFLGRKCCVPGEPVFAGTGSFDSAKDALSSVPWRPRIAAVDANTRGPNRAVDCFLEHPPGTPPPDGARVVYDAPHEFGYYNHGPRYVSAVEITVPVGEPLFPQRPPRPWVDPYGPGWDDVKKERRKRDDNLCVFCKSPAEEVHHLDYANVTVDTTRSLCKLCHEACTMHEYGNDMRRLRIDPSDPALRPLMLQTIQKLLERRRTNRRQDLLEAGRNLSDAFFDESPGR